MEERVVLYKMTKAEIDAMPISNGSIYFQTDGVAHYVYIDTDDTRVSLGIVTDTVLSTVSTNAIANSTVATKFNSIDTKIGSLTANNFIESAVIADSVPSVRNSSTIYFCKS